MDQATGKFSEDVKTLTNKSHLLDAEKQLTDHVPASRKEVELAGPILLIIMLMIISSLLIGIF
ncbi:MAG TPA: hypothetical protein IGS37_08995 [Synechococcales cyanobacterium M55_K2018_004]|nr:hypothetical protein [Synechococcales cyanobacterium M55_K2018_004]